MEQKFNFVYSRSHGSWFVQIIAFLLVEGGGKGLLKPLFAWCFFFETLRRAP